MENWKFLGKFLGEFYIKSSMKNVGKYIYIPKIVGISISQRPSFITQSDLPNLNAREKNPLPRSVQFCFSHISRKSTVSHSSMHLMW